MWRVICAGIYESHWLDDLIGCVLSYTAATDAARRGLYDAIKGVVIFISYAVYTNKTHTHTDVFACVHTFARLAGAVLPFLRVIYTLLQRTHKDVRRLNSFFLNRNRRRRRRRKRDFSVVYSFPPR